MKMDEPAIMQRSSALLQPYVSERVPGDFAPDFETLDETGRALRMRADCFAGRPMILGFVGALDHPATQAWLGQWQAAESAIEAAGAHLMFVSSDTNAAQARQIKRSCGLLAPVCGDPTGAIQAQYGLCHGRDLQEPGSARIVIITANGQVRRIMDRSEAGIESSLETVRELGVEAAGKAREGWIPGHAPILVIPNALDPEDCRTLIERFEASDGFRVDRPAPEETAEHKFMVSDYNRQDRIDHVLKDPALLARLDQRLAERVMPQVQKAFAFQVTRRELLHIARYKGAREGIHIGHRDNTHPSSQYRRFALSISLNDDYEGGGLVFREYSGLGYRGAVGTAFVFASGLLHEIEETTKGVRYNLISHLFNDASLQQPGR